MKRLLIFTSFLEFFFLFSFIYLSIPLFIFLFFYLRVFISYLSFFRLKNSHNNKHSIERFVAEKISYFCLARNLIRPLGSTHNFTQSGWLILFFPDYLSWQHKLGKSARHFLFFFYRRTSSFGTDVYLSALQ